VCCSGAGRYCEEGDSDLGSAESEGRDVDNGGMSALGSGASGPPLPLDACMRGRGGGRRRLLNREQTPNRLTPDCRHSSTVTSSTPYSFCSATLETRSMSCKNDDGL
jgi:hypothetical protein